MQSYSGPAAAASRRRRREADEVIELDLEDVGVEKVSTSRKLIKLRKMA